MTKPIRCVVVNDWMGAAGFTAGEEATNDVASLQLTLGREVELVDTGPSLYQFRDMAIDLLVVDYGGLLPGSSDTARSQIDYIIHWAEDHPGCLVLIYTEFTVRQYGPELKDVFGRVPNIIPYYAKSDDERAGLRSWFPETLFTAWAEPVHDHLVTPRRPGRYSDGEF